MLTCDAMPTAHDKRKLALNDIVAVKKRSKKKQETRFQRKRQQAFFGALIVGHRAFFHQSSRLAFDDQVYTAERTHCKVSKLALK